MSVSIRFGYSVNFIKWISFSIDFFFFLTELCFLGKYSVHWSGNLMNKAQKLAQACNIWGFFPVIRGTCPAVHLFVEPRLSPPTFLSLLPLLLLRLGIQSQSSRLLRLSSHLVLGSNYVLLVLPLVPTGEMLKDISEVTWKFPVWRYRFSTMNLCPILPIL